MQQLENTKLAKQKSDKEKKLLKAHIRPVFLFQSLTILHKKIISCKNDAPMMVLQLSELLSHLLYDCDKELICLKQELKMIELLIDIRKFDKHRNLSIEMFIHGADDRKYISPLLLFSYVQTVLDDVEDNEGKNNSLNIVVNIKDKTLLCELHCYIEAVAEFNLFHSSESLKTGANTIGVYP